MKYDQNPIFIVLQDKLAVKKYAKDRKVNTANLLYETKDPETIPFDRFPSKYFIKANHGWQWNILFFEGKWYNFLDGQGMANEDGSLLNKESAAPYELSKEEVIEMCKGWLKHKHLQKEWCYQHIEPYIFVEELLYPAEGTSLIDYRMYTFDGEVKAISLGSSEYRRNNQNAFFTPDWKLFELTSYKEELPSPLPPKPERLQEMLDSASRLGQGINFVRIDLYDTTDGIMLGEMTIYPESGYKHSPTSCKVFNRWLGSQWKTTQKDDINAFYWNYASFIKNQNQRILNRLRK